MKWGQRCAKTAKKCYPARKLLKIDFGIGFSRLARRTFRCQRRFRLACFAILNLGNSNGDFGTGSSQILNIHFSMKLLYHFLAKVDRRCEVETEMRKNRKKVLPGAKIIKNRFWGWVFAYGSSHFSMSATISAGLFRNCEFEDFEWRFRLKLVTILNLSSDFA